jgi:hypothetical protein
VVAYDDRYSVEYLDRRLRPYWRRHGAGAAELIGRSLDRYEALRDRIDAFDADLMAELESAGGRGYAELAALSYRQCVAAHKLVADVDGRAMLFSKENFSNGCAATVDVAYPTLPFYLCFSGDLLAATLRPLLRYAALDRWRFPFAPHDLGRYPKANGQVYGGGETDADGQMPIEESGNMIIMAFALHHMGGHDALLDRHWPELSTWADYLAEHGFDPANQLCTDDFMGHMAHNANLSIKAIVALACFAELCRLREMTAEADRYRALAEDFVQRWIESSADDSGATRLAFDRPGTWSQKYNLVWDVIFGLELFPPTLIERELDHYRRHIAPYGLPLDSRSEVTKLDWIVWTATLADDDDTWQALLEPTLTWVNETIDRVPLSDCYWTHEPRKRSFQARSVVGGTFIKLLRARGEGVPAAVR